MGLTMRTREYRLCAVLDMAEKLKSAPFDVLSFDDVKKEVLIFDKATNGYLVQGPVQFVQRYHAWFRSVLKVERVPILIGCLQDDIVIYASRPAPGRRAEELVGLPWDMLFVDEHAGHVESALDLARECGAAVLVGNATDPTAVLAVPVKNLLIRVPADNRMLSMLAVAEEGAAILGEAANDE